MRRYVRFSLLLRGILQLRIELAALIHLLLPASGAADQITDPKDGRRKARFPNDRLTEPQLFTPSITESWALVLACRLDKTDPCSPEVVQQRPIAQNLTILD